MQKILLDTNAYSAFKQNEPAINEIIQHCETIGICSIVLGELLGGFAFGSKEQKNRSELSSFLNSPRISMLNITETTATFYKTVYAALRKKGKPIPTNDLWIAASALEHGYAICTYDAHFKVIDGLLVGNKKEDFLI